MILARVLRIMVVTAIIIPALCTKVSASICSHSLKYDRFVSQTSRGTKEVIKAKPDNEECAAEENFFNTTAPLCSKAGVVKTYTIRAVMRNSSDAFYARSTDSVAVRIFNRPINGILSSTFGYRIHPKRKKRHLHSGIDLAAKSGTPIACAGNGKVIFAGWKSGYGYVVVVDHGNGYETLYAHCSKLAVTAGQAVTTGKTIGYVGRTGVATGSHLHFEVRKNGVYRNPLKYLKN